MLLGTIYAIITGLLWASIGVVFSYITKKKLDFLSIISISSLMSFLASLIVFPDYEILLNESIPKLWEMAVFLSLSGVFQAIGMNIMQKSMQKGSHAASWTISQSAMVIPFIAGLVFWNDAVSYQKMTGLLIKIIPRSLLRGQKLWHKGL